MAMQYTTRAEQPYTQVAATEAPHTMQETIAEYDTAEVGSYVHWFDGWRGHEGTVQWTGEWTQTGFGRLNERERLMVVAVPEQVNANGIDSHGGLFLLSLHRWTETFSHPTGEQYSVTCIASTGIRYRQPVEAFLAETVRRHEAERSFDQAIVSQLDEENDW